jgi:sec-independent protein translocase protein TatA
MFRGLFDGPGWIIVLVVVVLLFGATRLPALARSLGQSTKILRDEMKTDKKADPPAPDAEASAAPMTVADPAAPPTKPASPSTAASDESGTTAKP